MTSVKPRLRSFCLGLLAAAALTGCLSANAQAAEWEWKIGGKTLAELKVTEAPVSATAGAQFTLAIPFYSTEIKCGSLSLAKGKLLAGGESHGTLILSGCKLSGPPFVTETCKLTEPIEAAVKISLVLHHTKTYELLAAAEAGKPLTTIRFAEKTECPLPLSNEVKGTLVTETEAGERTEQPLRFSSSVEALFPTDTISFSGNPATFSGEAKLTLGEPYKGSKWTSAAISHSGEYLIGKQTLTERKITEATLTGSVSKTFVYSLPTNNYEIACSSMEVLTGTLLTKGIADLKLLLTKCITYVYKPLEEWSSCQVTDVTIDATALATVHAGHAFLLLEPLAGKSTFMTYAFPAGKGCVWDGKEFSVSGTLGFELGTAQVTQTLQLGDLTVESALGDAPTFGVQTPVFSGTLSLSLGGAFKGETWGAV